MSYTLPIITVTAGQPAQISIPGELTNVSWVKIANESPYLLNIVGLVSGSDWIDPYTVQAYPVDGLTSAIQAMATDVLNAGATAPAAFLAVTWYLPGEKPSGSYPMSLQRLTNIGNSTVINSLANTLEQDVLTPFVYYGLNPTKDGVTANQLDVTAGVAFARQTDNSLLRLASGSATYFTSAHSATYFLDLNPDGSWIWGISHSTVANYIAIAQVTTDGSGNISAVTDERSFQSDLLALAAGPLGGGPLSQPGLTYPGFFSAVGGYRLGAILGGIQSAFGADINGNIFVQLTTGSGSPLGLYFLTNASGTPANPLSIGGQFGTGPAGLAKSWFDNAGVLHAVSPVTLAAGNQETGRYGLEIQNATAGNNGSSINFKTNMTNVPTSITFNAFNSLNFTTIAAAAIFVQGVDVAINVTAAGHFFWHGAYTTVGNCLLAVDAAAGVFSHHCDTCGAVHRDIPLASFTITPHDMGPCLSYVCPDCGATEGFNTRLSAADEADTTPQGSGEYVTTRGAQARLIRAALAALGLEVAP